MKVQAAEDVISIFLPQVWLGISSQGKPARPDCSPVLWPSTALFFSRSSGHFGGHSECTAAGVKGVGGMRRALAAPELVAQGFALLSGSSVARSRGTLGDYFEYSSKWEPHRMSLKWECSHNYVLRAGTSGEATILFG